MNIIQFMKPDFDINHLSTTASESSFQFSFEVSNNSNTDIWLESSILWTYQYEPYRDNRSISLYGGFVDEDSSRFVLREGSNKKLMYELFRVHFGDNNCDNINTGDILRLEIKQIYPEQLLCHFVFTCVNADLAEFALVLSTHECVPENGLRYGVQDISSSLSLKEAGKKLHYLVEGDEPPLKFHDAMQTVKVSDIAVSMEFINSEKIGRDRCFVTHYFKLTNSNKRWLPIEKRPRAQFKRKLAENIEVLPFAAFPMVAKLRHSRYEPFGMLVSDCVIAISLPFEQKSALICDDLLVIEIKVTKPSAILGFVFRYNQQTDCFALYQSSVVDGESVTRVSLSDLEARFSEFLNTTILKHKVALLRKRQQTTTEDDYGNVILTKWESELDYFIKSVLMTNSDLSGYISTYKSSEFLQQLINELLDQQINGSMPHEYVISLDPIGYEHHCASLLNGNGWNARTTKGSGDQGVDVIATHGNIKAVFQCKKYSQPVGNAAVQEIIAGKQFEQAHIAAVISNQTFTQSAKQLAGATNVFLLHHDELPGFAARVGLAPEPPVT